MQFAITVWVRFLEFYFAFSFFYVLFWLFSLVCLLVDRMTTFFFSCASLWNVEMRKASATKAQWKQSNQHSDSQAQEFTFMFYFSFCRPYKCRPVGGLRRRKTAPPSCSWRQQRKHLAKGSNITTPKLMPTRWRRWAMLIHFCQLHGWCWMTGQISNLVFFGGWKKMNVFQVMTLSIPISSLSQYLKGFC